MMNPTGLRGPENAIRSLERQMASIREEYQAHSVKTGDGKSAMTMRDVKRCERAMKCIEDTLAKLDSAIGEALAAFRFE